MSILNKRLKDLTPEDIAAHKRYIGTPEFPMPVKKIVELKQDDGSTIHTEVWGTLDDPETSPYVLSDRSQDEVTGMVFRELPAPEHSRYAIDMISNAQPDGERRIQYFKGTRGGGKTYSIEWMGRLMSYDGTDVINCGNADLSNLVFETVLDNGGNSIFDLLDRKIRNNQINPLTRKALEKIIGADAISEDGIDWAKAAENDKDDKALVKILGLDQNEEFGAAGNALGLSQRVGRFVENLDSGRPTLLDEYPRHKAGSDAGFHRLFEYVAGLIPDYYEQSTMAQKGDKAGSIINLKDEDRKVGSLVMLSGNTEADGDDVHELPESVYSRVDVKYFPDLEIEGWQARWCHILSGVPISTHYYAQQEKWDDDPEGFSDYLQKGRVIGLPQEKVEAIPASQFDFLERWTDTLEASRILAEFCHGWADTLSQASAGVGFSELMMEVGEVYKKEMSMDPRKIKRFFDQSQKTPPQVRLDNETLEKIVDLEPGLEDTMGYRLVRNILDFAYLTTRKIGKDSMHSHLIGLAERVDLNLVIGLLNKNPYLSNNPRIQRDFTRDMVWDVYKDKSAAQGSITLTKEDFNPELISFALDQAQKLANGEAQAFSFEAEEGNQEESEKNSVERAAFKPSMVLMSEDIDDLLENPFENAYSIDSAFVLSGKVEMSDMQREFSKSVDYESFLRSLALPQIRESNIKNLWDMGLTESGLYSNDNAESTALTAAQALDSARMAITSVKLKTNKEQPAVLHIIRNTKTSKMALVGEKPSSAILAHFEKANICFIDKADETAPAKIDRIVKELADSTDDSVAKNLKAAFLLRNSVEGHTAEEYEKIKLGKLMCHEDIKTTVPRWVLKEAHI